MEVDSVPDLPTLPSFLGACLAYTTSPAILRSALRHSLKDAEDILAVVKVLHNWIDQWGKRDVRLLPSKKDVAKNEHGVVVLKAKEKEVHRDLPPLSKVNHTSFLLVSLLIHCRFFPSCRLYSMRPSLLSCSILPPTKSCEVYPRKSNLN